MVAKNKSYEEFYEEEEKKTSFTRTKNEDEVFYEDDDEEFSTPPKEQQHGSYVQEAIVCVHTLVHRSKVGVVVGLRGRTIFDIERRTGASVSILRDEEEEEGKEGKGKEERVKVVLTGTAQMCKEAAKIIESISDGKIIDEKTTTEKDGRKETHGRRSVSVSRAGDGEKLLRPLEKAFLGWTRKTGEEDEDEDSYSSGEEDIISTEDEENDDNGEVEECSFNHHRATAMTTTMTTKHRKTPPPYERDASRFFGTLSTATVRIPDAKVALIIGKQGAHIEFLRHMTGCSLNMASEVVDVGDVFLNKDERVFKAATNMAERVLLIESTSLTDVARCVALVADIVEGTLYLQSKKSGGVGFSSTDDDAMPYMKEIHVSIREYASVMTKTTFRVKTKAKEVKRTFTFSSSSQQQQQQQQQQHQHQQCTSTTSSQSRRMSTSSSPERRSYHQQNRQHRVRQDSEQQQHYSSSSYYDYYANPPSLKFDPITNELLAVVPPHVVSAPPPPSINVVNVDEDNYFCEDDESDAYSTDSDFAA